MKEEWNEEMERELRRFVKGFNLENMTPIDLLKAWNEHLKQLKNDL